MYRIFTLFTAVIISISAIAQLQTSPISGGTKAQSPKTQIQQGPAPANTPNNYRISGSRAEIVRGWYSFPDAQVASGLNFQGYSPFIFKDTFYQYQTFSDGAFVPNDFDTINFCSYGASFHLNDDVWELDNDETTVKATKKPFILDSIGVPYLYNRVVDSVRVQKVTGKDTIRTNRDTTVTLNKSVSSIYTVGVMGQIFTVNGNSLPIPFDTGYVVNIPLTNADTTINITDSLAVDVEMMRIASVFINGNLIPTPNDTNFSITYSRNYTKDSTYQIVDEEINDIVETVWEDVVDTLVIQVFTMNQRFAFGDFNDPTVDRFATVEYDNVRNIGRNAQRTIRFELTRDNIASWDLTAVNFRTIAVPLQDLIVDSNANVVAIVSFQSGIPTLKNFDTLDNAEMPITNRVNAYRGLFTNDQVGDNITSYNNGLVVNRQQRYSASWFLPLNGQQVAPRYLPGNLFGGTQGRRPLYPNVYFHATVERDEESSIADNNIISNINIFPNPATQSARIKLNLLQNEYARITLNSQLGQVINLISEGNMSIGENFVDVDLSNVKPGIYFVNVQTGNINTVQKLVVR